MSGPPHIPWLCFKRNSTSLTLQLAKCRLRDESPNLKIEDVIMCCVIMAPLFKGEIKMCTSASDFFCMACFKHLWDYFIAWVVNLTYLRSWALLEEPLIEQPLKNFPAFHGTQSFNTVFTRAHHWSLSWAISIQSTPSHPMILSTQLRLGLPSGLFPSGLPTNIL
jgi:hypothetical protein